MTDLIVPVKGSRPVLLGTTIEPRHVIERFNEGRTVLELATEFSIAVELVEAAIRSHTLQHAMSIKKVQWNATRANKEGWFKIALRNLEQAEMSPDIVKKWCLEETNGMFMMHIVDWRTYMAIAFTDEMDAMACMLKFPNPSAIQKFRSKMRDDPTYDDIRQFKKMIKARPTKAVV